MLESNIVTDQFAFVPDKNVANKAIFTIEFLNEVWLENMNIICSSVHHRWFATFKWQGWNGKDWEDVGKATNTSLTAFQGTTDVKSFLYVGDANSGFWTFPNQTHFSGKKFSQWRAIGIAGTTQSGALNLAFFKIK